MYVDTLLGYRTSSSDYITLRSSKLGEVYLDIETYIPMYVSVKWRDEANNTGLQTKRVGRGEKVRFTYNMPTATESLYRVIYIANPLNCWETLRALIPQYQRNHDMKV